MLFILVDKTYDEINPKVSSGCKEYCNQIKSIFHVCTAGSKSQILELRDYKEKRPHKTL